MKGKRNNAIQGMDERKKGRKVAKKQQADLSKHRKILKVEKTPERKQFWLIITWKRQIS